MNTINHKTRNSLKYIVVSIILFCTLFSYQSAFASSITSENLGKLLNQTREEYELNTLSYDSKLYSAAKAKSEHMILKNYFDHYAPDGTSPWDFINEAGYEYKIAGENLAMDFETAEALHNAWMNSPSHKDNIINPKFSDYAIAVNQGKIDGIQTTVVVQMFGTKLNPVIAETNHFVNSLINFLLGIEYK